MDSGTVPVILPKIEADFPNTPTATFSFVLTAYTIALAALVVVSGRLRDRTARNRQPGSPEPVRRPFTAQLGKAAAGGG